MSKAKMVKIDRDRFDRWLHCQGVSQKWLCDNVLMMDPISLNRCLRNGKISEANMRLIAEALNVDPNWLAGEAPGLIPITHKMKTLEDVMAHESQVMDMLFTINGCGGVAFSDLTGADQAECKNIIGWTLLEFLIAKGYYTGNSAKDFNDFSNTMNRMREKNLPGMSNFEDGPLWVSEAEEEEKNLALPLRLSFSKVTPKND